MLKFNEPSEFNLFSLTWYRLEISVKIRQKRRKRLCRIIREESLKEHLKLEQATMLIKEILGRNPKLEAADMS